MIRFLSPTFLSSYPDMPENMNELGAFVFYRTYSRWLPHQGRRETWKEAVSRAVNYNINIAFKELLNKHLPTNPDSLVKEAEELFDNIFNLRQFLSGRTHWVGGAESKVADKFPLSNFNCSFINIDKWENLCHLFYLLLVGVGVGIKCTKEMAKHLPPIRKNFTVIHSEYKSLPISERLEHTTINKMVNGYVKIYIGDSKEGWVDALAFFIRILTEERYKTVHTIKFSYNSIRPRGEKLQTFGGTASGHASLLEMFVGIEKVLKGEMHDAVEHTHNNGIRPINILDICNLIGNNVVVGGVRRTAEMFLFDSDDTEVIQAKKDIMSSPHLYHRFMSNNSVAFTSKPTKEELHKLFEGIKENGEPGFVNLESAKKRRTNVEGLNPCAEVLLDSFGVCNLTTVNVKSFIINEKGKKRLAIDKLFTAQRLSTRAAVRMTCIDLEIKEFDDVQKRDRLTGVSLTGWQDAMEILDFNSYYQQQILSKLAEVARDEARSYAKYLRIPEPLLVTTIKPEGTLSQVAGGVSSGLHKSFAPYYIRRIRINSHDALVDVARKLGWSVVPEVGEEEETAKTFVIEFPVASGAEEHEQSVGQQFATYFRFQKYYTDHNSSITIYVKPDEWSSAEKIVYECWDDIIGVSFLPVDGGTYELAPYEKITEEKYHSLKSKMKPFDYQLLYDMEREEAATEIIDEGCATGICPIR